MNQSRAWLLSPAAPALLLVFGLVFGFAIAHFSGLRWSTTATRLYYLSLLCWSCVILAFRWKRWGPLGISDGIFLAFVLLVTGSLALHWEGSAAAAYYGKMLPFLVLLPYVLGRLVEAPDFSFMVRALPRLGFLLLLFCVADFWLVPNPEAIQGRWTFFGLNHTPLLIAQVLSVGLLVQVYIALVPEGRLASDSGNRAIVWGGLGLMAVALVMVAARGALIGAALTTILLIALTRGQWRRKILLAAYLSVAVCIAFQTLPVHLSEFYSRLKTTVAEDAPVSALSEDKNNNVPMVRQGDPRCQPLTTGVNSVAIRRVLYQEAIDLAIQHPLAGVGASNFGKYSCAGEGAYPHSTVLQAFAELGVAGGSLLLALIAISLLNCWRVNATSREPVFWLALLAFFTFSDQIYGSYFMAAGSFFLFGVTARLRIRHSVTLPFSANKYVNAKPAP